ncbi:MarR family winged helix-turn-helix transcriptional regulator [Agrobacterium sp. ES01]|uniref:MarR family winged helix-turn-helix transcriptional regulator n=1 Tax=Agrobacterium sp. ES01 TaxID=3420714 RepID=UPI003D142674
MSELLDLPPARMTRLIANTARLWRRAANRRLQPYGLTEATWLPLLHIFSSQNAMRQKDLANKLMLDGSSVVRVVDNLEKAGLVSRVGNPGDRRSKEVVLTEEGLVVVTKVTDIAFLLASEASSGIDQHDMETARRVLSHMSRFLSQELGDEIENDD